MFLKFSAFEHLTGLDVDYSKMDKVESVKAAAGLMASGSASERSGKRKASLSTRENQPLGLGMASSAFSSVTSSSQLSGRAICLT